MRRIYDAAQMPFQWLKQAKILTAEQEKRLTAIYRQPGLLRNSQCRLHFVFRPCGLGDESMAPGQLPNKDTTAQGDSPADRLKRKYHRTKKPQEPRWWRSRYEWLTARPKRTAKSVFEELQQRYSDRFPDRQLRTCQRRVQRWRATILLSFDS